MEVRKRASVQRKVKAPSTRSTPTTSTQAYVPTCPDWSCEPIDSRRAAREVTRCRSTTESVDQADVDAAPQQVARDADDRLDDGRRRRSRPRSTCRRAPSRSPPRAATALRHERRRLEARQGDRDTGDGDQRPRAPTSAYSGARATSRAAPPVDAQRRCADHRLEPVLEHADRVRGMQRTPAG